VVVHIPWQWISSVRELRRFAPDVHLCPLNIPMPPWRVVANNVITLHDIKFLTNPEMLKLATMAFDRFFCRRAMIFVRRIITPSHYSKQAILDYFQVDPSLVEVVYHGIDTTVFRPEPLPAPSEACSRLPEAYLFFPAATWPYKNHARLIEALAILRARKRLIIPLVLTGFPTTAHRLVQESLQKHQSESHVTWLGWISPQELVYVYQNARALVFPSLYEGFGLPIVEAMACGCPVACSRTTSCAEVAGDAALTFDPVDTEEMAAQIESIWTDAAVRKDVIAKGLEKAKEFSATRMAEETLKVLSSVSAGNGRD
jgi:glycosyltransferase involved in cell wall biosynthesis